MPRLHLQSLGTGEGLKSNLSRSFTHDRFLSEAQYMTALQPLLLLECTTAVCSFLQANSATPIVLRSLSSSTSSSSSSGHRRARRNGDTGGDRMGETAMLFCIYVGSSSAAAAAADAVAQNGNSVASQSVVQATFSPSDSLVEDGASTGARRPSVHQHEHQQQTVLLQKDDLVVLFCPPPSMTSPSASSSSSSSSDNNHGGGIMLTSIAELAQTRHCLAAVTSVDCGEDARPVYTLTVSSHKQRLQLRAGGPAYCVAPLVSLVTHAREWAALVSVSDPRLVPLTPYLLKGAPVASASALE
jgi:hypothetical protein